MQAWWRSRNRRERLMLGVMVSSLAAFALWYGVLWPLRAARDAAQRRYDAAVATLAEARSMAAQVQGLREGFSAPPQASELPRAVLENAAAAGIVISRQRTDTEGRFTIDIDAVAAPALFAWLDGLHRGSGVVAYSLRIQRRADAVSAVIVFATVAP